MRIGSPAPMSVFGHFANERPLREVDALLLRVVAVVQTDADDLLGVAITRSTLLRRLADKPRRSPRR